jgi:hypothetical protein
MELGVSIRPLAMEKRTMKLAAALDFRS